MMLYTFFVFFAIIYLGEHYIIDVLAGMLLAYLVYFLVYHTSLLSKAEKTAHEIHPPDSQILLKKFTSIMVIIILCLSAGLLTEKLKKTFFVNPYFIEKEIKERRTARSFFYKYAFHYSKYRDEVKQISRAINLGKHSEGIRQNDILIAQHPQEPEPVFWSIYFKYISGIYDTADVKNSIKTLENFRNKEAKKFQTLLRILININERDKTFRSTAYQVSDDKINVHSEAQKSPGLKRGWAQSLRAHRFCSRDANLSVLL
jgi:Ca2+/Na+ antiporter